MRAFRELTLILLALAGALALSQLPGYIAAYEQRLGGALDEARRTLAGFMSDAQASGLGFEGYVAKLRDNPDASVAARNYGAWARRGPSMAQRSALTSQPSSSPMAPNSRSRLGETR